MDEDALICDLAETYNIYDYKNMPPGKVAIFCMGLRDNSRIKLRLQKQKVPLETILLADIRDKINLLVWSKTKDGQKNRNRPKLVVSELVEKQSNSNHKTYYSGKDFEEERREILEGINGIRN